jgi:ABC-type transport system substrate-binding protein
MDNTALANIRNAREGYDALISNSSSVNPLGVLGSIADQNPNGTSNTPNYNNPEFIALDEKADETTDLAELDRIAAEMAKIAMEDVPVIPIGASGRYAYFWPWVKNYYGEAMGGGTNYGPFVATIWIDQQLKKELGF